MPFTTISLSPLELLLDSNNPRFVYPINSTQEEIRKYLLQNEDVIELVHDIINYGGLMLGERLIVCEENGKYVVLEGNRRACACQLLLNNTLIPETYKELIPTPPKTVLDEIRIIEADLAPSREAAHPILTSRHIKRIKEWPPVPKRKYYNDLYEKYGSTKKVAEITQVESEKEILKDIKEYRLLAYAKNLPKSKNDIIINSKNIKDIEITIFTRPFSSSIIGLRYDDNLQPYSIRYEKDIFDEICYLILKATINNDINTRSTFKKVPGLLDLLEKHKQSSQTEVADQPPHNEASEQSSHSEAAATTEANSTDDKTTCNEDSIENSSQFEKSYSKQNSNDFPRFFEGLNCRIPTTQENKGIYALVEELQKLSRTGDYSKYGISSIMLLRSLIEQSMKYYLRKKGFYDKLEKEKDDPQLSHILKFYKKRLDKLFDEPNIIRLYTCLFESDGNKNLMDFVVHQTHIIQPNKPMLDSFSKSGLVAYINYLICQ